MIDGDGVPDVSTDNGDVMFLHLAGFELPSQLLCCIAMQPKNQHARCRLVEPVYRVYVLAKLVAQQLHGKTRFVAIDRAAMHQQAGWLVDCGVVVIFVEYLQHNEAHDEQRRAV